MEETTTDIEQPQQPVEETKLQRSWSVWEHRRDASGGAGYGTNMTELATFSTIEGFWRFANRIPPPSSMFSSEDGPKKFDGREIEAISVFQKGIRPEWEDAKNMHGGEVSIRRTMGSGQLDQWWEDLLLGLIGETLDPTDVITGVRIVDKSSKNKISYKLEIWFSCNDQTDPQLVAAIRENIGTALNTQPKLEYKPHSQALANDNNLTRQGTPMHAEEQQQQPPPQRTGSGRRMNN